METDNVASTLDCSPPGANMHTTRSGASVVTVNLKNIPQYLKERPSFALWRGIKKPLQPDGKPARLDHAEEWCSFEAAANALATRKFDGLGFRFNADDGIACVDLDHCRDMATGAMQQWASDLVNDFPGTFIELSPSGTGVHIWGLGPILDKSIYKKRWEIDKDTKQGVDMLDGSHNCWLTLTGIIPDEVKPYYELTDIQESLKTLREKHHRKDRQQLKRVVTSTSVGSGDAKVDELRDALKHVIPADYDDWLKLSMALKLESEFSIFHEWCAGLPKYPGIEECQRKWDHDLKPDGTKTLKSIFKIARLNGWKPKPVEIQRAAIKQAAVEPENVEKKESVQINGSQECLAELAVESYGSGNLIFTKSDFYFYNGKHWKVISRDIIAQRLKRIQNSIKDLLHMHERKELTASRQQAVIALMQRDVAVEDVEFNKACESIAAKNGELFLVDGKWERRNHDKRNYRLDLLPHDYNPSATAPRFDRLLDEVFEGDEDAADKKECILQWFGYCLTTDNRYRKFMIFYGPGKGHNGKSKICFALSVMVGVGNCCSVDPSKLDERFKMSALYGKLVSIVPDLDDGAKMADGALKMLTGGDPVEIEFKGRDPFSIIPYCKIITGTNTMPYCRDTSDAFYTRAIIIKFNRSFLPLDHPERTEAHPIPDPELEDLLREEGEGIFNMALAALARLRSRGSFTEPASAHKLRKQWKADGDEVLQFVDEVCQTGPELSASNTVLYDTFRKWLQQSGVEKKFSNKRFGQRLENLNYKAGHNGICRVRSGIDIDPNKWREF